MRALVRFVGYIRARANAYEIPHYSSANAFVKTCKNMLRRCSRKLFARSFVTIHEQSNPRLPVLPTYSILNHRNRSLLPLSIDFHCSSSKAFANHKTSTKRTSKKSAPKTTLRPKQTRKIDRWVKVIDRTTGNHYFWNRETNETTALGREHPPCVVSTNKTKINLSLPVENKKNVEARRAAYLERKNLVSIGSVQSIFEREFVKSSMVQLATVFLFGIAGAFAVTFAAAVLGLR